MTDRTVAKRYAKALFAIGEEQGKSEAFAKDMDALKTLVADNEEVQHMLENQSIENSQKKSAMMEMVGDMEPMVKNFISVVLEKGRGNFFVVMCDAYQGFMEAAANTMLATVTSAVPLSQDQVAQIEEKFSELMHMTVKAKTVVDPALVGGVQVMVGDKLFDGTIANQMKQLSEKLKEQRC